jgi:hypothetical protein
MLRSDCHARALLEMIEPETLTVEIEVLSSSAFGPLPGN